MIKFHVFSCWQSGSVSWQVVVPEFLPIEKAKSFVWRFLVFPACDGKFLESGKKNRRSIRCKLCKKVLSYKGNTTRWSISSIIIKMNFIENNPWCWKNATTSGQHSIAEAFEQLSPMPKSFSRWQSLTELICYMKSTFVEWTYLHDHKIVGCKHTMYMYMP